jgi:nitronate monooxygenase
MSFGSGGSSKSKAWKDIWGCGQGIGAVKSIQTTQALVDRLAMEYREAKSKLA